MDGNVLVPRRFVEWLRGRCYYHGDKTQGEMLDKLLSAAPAEAPDGDAGEKLQEIEERHRHDAEYLSCATISEIREMGERAIQHRAWLLSHIATLQHQLSAAKEEARAKAIEECALLNGGASRTNANQQSLVSVHICGCKHPRPRHRGEGVMGGRKSEQQPTEKTGGVDRVRLGQPDWSGKCEVCGSSPIVPETGMCGPCTFGEAETVGGNW